MSTSPNQQHIADGGGSVPKESNLANQTLQMPEAQPCTLLSVAANDNGEKILEYNDSVVPAELCQQSETLRELLDTCGLVTLPIPPTLFESWIQFAAAPNTASVIERDDDYCLATLAGLIEVSQFMCNTAIEAAAAFRVARIFRRFFREDILAGILKIGPGIEVVHIPPNVPAFAGPNLRMVISCLPPLPAVTVAAIVRHLSLTEAILLPPPFPGQALAHFLETTGGVLDLSPPQVPVHTPDSLIIMTQKLEPLLAAAPPVTALHIAAPCLSSHSAAAPLLPHLSAVTRLCITHGKITYEDLSSPCCIDTSIAVPLLAAVSPSALRHLSIDAVLDMNSALVHYVLSTFTALTSLRLHDICHPDAVRMMPRLESLYISNIAKPVSTVACSRARSVVEDAPQLRHIHASGDGQGVSHLYNDFRNRREAVYEGGEDVGGKRSRPAIPPVLTQVADGDEDEDLDGNEVLCCGFPFVPEAVSLLRDKSARMGTVSTVSHFFTFAMIWHAWGPDAVGGVHGSTGGSAQTQAAERLRELTLAVQTTTDAFDALLWRVLAGQVPHTLRTLCVLPPESMPPLSPLSAERSKCPELWVTARPSGVAHPLCALEMLHYSGAPHALEPCVESLGGLASNASAHSGFDTLRLPICYFPFLRDLVLKAAPSCTGLQDLSIHCTPGVHVDLSPLALLPHLRALSFECMDITLPTIRYVGLPPSLTALRMHGRVALPQAARELGWRVQALRQLQCLDIDLVATLEPPPADACDCHVDVFVAFAQTKWELWLGLETALVKLPLHLGATIRVAPCEELLLPPLAGGAMHGRCKRACS